MAIDSTKPTVVVESSALPSGASTEATLALIKAKTDNLDVALSTRTKPADQQHAIVDSSVLPTGAATEATLATRLSESDFDAKTGSLTESAPASDTASSGLNGRLQRIAQRITSLIALLPAALGAGGGLKVDGSGTALPVSGTVTANAGSGTLAVSLASVPSHDVTNAGSFAAQITSHVPGTAATNLGKAEDAVAASGDTGVAVLAVRRDAAASGVSADGDYANLSVDSNGALRVTGGGGGTQYNLDDVASATATGTVALVVRKDSAASLAGTDGDITGLQVDASGALRVTGGGGGTEYTEDAAAAANPAGQMLILRRKDTLSSAEVSADGDNIAANATAKGELYVKHTDAVAVTNANLDAALSTLLTQSDFDSDRKSVV